MYDKSWSTTLISAVVAHNQLINIANGMSSFGVRYGFTLHVFLNQQPQLAVQSALLMLLHTEVKDYYCCVVINPIVCFQ